MTDYNTLQRKRNLIVGGFVMVAFVAFVWMLMIFGELPVAATKLRSFRVLVNFPTAPGVQPDTPVLYCGYQIGRVKHVSVPTLNTKTRQHQIKVTCLIDRKFIDIPKNVDIKIMKRGLGSSYIEMFWDPEKGLPSAEPNEPLAAIYLRDEMELDGSTGTSSEFFPPDVQEKLENLVDSITALANSANDVIGDEGNKANIKKTLGHITEASSQARETLKSIQNLSDTGSEQVVYVADEINQVADELTGAIAEFRTILVKINQGQGTAGRLVEDARLYENLLDSSLELEMALQQLKEWAADAREKGIRIKW